MHSLIDPRFPVKTCPKCGGHRLVYSRFPPRRLELRIAGAVLILTCVFAPIGVLLIVLSCLLQRGQVRCLGCDFQGEAGP